MNYGVFENMPKGVAIYQVLNKGETAADYIVKFVNRAALHSLGYELDQLTGKSLLELSADLNSLNHIPILKKVWESGNSELHPAQKNADTPNKRYYENSVFKLPSGEIAVIYYDITELKKKQSELQICRNIILSTFDGAAFVDRNYRYGIVNAAYEQRSGFTQEQLSTMTVADYHGEDTFKNVIKPIIDRCLQGEKITYREWFTYPVSGKRLMEVTCTPCNDLNNEIFGVIVNSRDITQLEEEDEIIREIPQKLAMREFETLTVLGRAAEYRDPETGNHINRVAHVSKLIACKLGLDASQQEIIFAAAPLHDVGKLGIPDSILQKPGKLTDEEFMIMKEHTYIGNTILQSNTNNYLKAGAEIALTHHEKFDGSGYPRGLKRTDIPLFGRIVAIADAYDAMISRRRYKERWDIRTATEIIRVEKGKHFDPDIADIFLANISQIINLYEVFTDTEIPLCKCI